MSLDRAAIERVLARAAELQAGQTTEAGTLLSDEQIVELGKEVGLTPDALRRAIAEERGRVAVSAPSGIAGAWFGHDQLSATRVVPGTPAAVLAALDTLMRNDLPFEVKRRFPDRLVWEPKNGFFDAMRQAFGTRTEGGDLVLTEEVGALVVAIDGARTHVRLDAALTARRTSAARAAAAFTTVSGLGAFALSTMAVAPVVVVPVTGVWAMLALLVPRRNFRATVTRAELALQQVLDRLEYGPAQRRGLAGEFVERLLGPSVPPDPMR